MSRNIFGKPLPAEPRKWPRSDCGPGNHLIGAHNECTECGFHDASRERWVQAMRVGMRVPADDAIATAIDMGGAAIHDGDCGLGKADYEVNPLAGTCTCTPEMVTAAARA